MAKHKPYSREVPHLIKYIKVYAAIVATIGTLLIVFKAHCLNKALLVVAIFAAAVPITFTVTVVVAEKLLSKITNLQVQKNLGSLLVTLTFMGVILSLFEANHLYCNTLLKVNCEIVNGEIITREIRKSKHNSWPVLIYYYNYNGTQYHDEIHEEDTNHRIGDYIQVRVSAFDATVNEVLP
ncbi:MAG TPA: hypothetical protein PLW44_01085 [Chitinophagales bacterium]|nr:hypothetical protein [Chitinophagales bacterium]